MERLLMLRLKPGHTGRALDGFPWAPGQHIEDEFTGRAGYQIVTAAIGDELLTDQQLRALAGNPAIMGAEYMPMGRGKHPEPITLEA